MAIKIKKSVKESKSKFLITKVSDNLYALAQGNPPIVNARKTITADSAEKAKEILMKYGYSEDELILDESCGKKKSVKESVEELNFVKLNDEPIEIEYVEDEHDESRDFQPSFWWGNQRYYLDDFVHIHNNPWVSGAYTYPEYIHAYESDNYHNPLYIEVADDGDYVNVYEEREVTNESCKEESVGEDVSEYQKWVDYDMKKYHKISKDTMDKIKSAGLSVVKDQYGDYEVIADRPVKESCKGKCNESKQPRIVEYISPERKALNKRVAEIDDKWYKDVTEDDIQFLNDNGLDYDTEKRSVVFADTRKKVDFPYYSRWSWDKDNGNVDWIDQAVKAGERNRKSDFGYLTRLGRDNHNYRTSDELKRTSKELADAKRWGTDRQEKVWQGKHDREKAKLADKRKDAYNKEWREEQNKEMSQDYRQLKYINKRLKDDQGRSYDAAIRRAENDKAKREQELLQRFKDELDSYQRQIDDAKATKDYALKRKAQILKKDNFEDISVDEVED